MATKVTLTIKPESLAFLTATLKYLRSLITEDEYRTALTVAGWNTSTKNSTEFLMAELSRQVQIDMNS